jgi:putative peptidoglycan lipid II flippase
VPAPTPTPDERRPEASHALLVAAGIFLSRIFGLIRQRVLSHYLGLSDAGDAFAAAFRIPNVLQNLLGEGVLSASFIPVYARLRALGKDDEAQHVANAVFGLLALVTSIIVLAGVVLAGPLTNVIAIGFPPAKHDLTVRLVRFLFPGAGLLVLSAWCLGVLNSHRRFLLSYTAPVVWNVAIIATLLFVGGSRGDAGSAIAAAIGSVIGSLLQFGVQLPTIFTLIGRLRPNLDARSDEIRQVIRNFGPVLVGRGASQISAFVDTMLASLLGQGAVAGLVSAQVLYTLPVSLFGMSVAASELPAMSSAIGSEDEIAAALRARLNSGLRRIAFFVVPSAMAFLAFGGVIAAALFQTGRFTAADSRYVWIILAGSTVGLLAGTMGRLYGSSYYALRDTRTPLRFAVLRVILTTVLGYVCAIPLPGLLGIDARWGVAGLTASAGVAGWIEFFLLRRGMNRRIGVSGVPGKLLLALWSAALLAAIAAYGVGRLVTSLHPIPAAIAILGTFGVGYIALTVGAGVPEARGAVRFLRR